MRFTTSESYTGHSVQDTCPSAEKGSMIVSNREPVAADQDNFRVSEQGSAHCNATTTDVRALSRSESWGPVPRGGILPNRRRVSGARASSNDVAPGPLLPYPHAMPESIRPPATRRASRTSPRTLARRIRAWPLQPCEGTTQTIGANTGTLRPS